MRPTDDAELIAQSGNRHEQRGAAGISIDCTPRSWRFRTGNFSQAQQKTVAALAAKVPVIYQAALESGPFSGYADFLLLDASGRYQVWDTKLARSPKPFYAIQLCCYSEMLAAMTGGYMPDKFGIILGTQERADFRVEDFVHYYRHIKNRFLALQRGFTGKLADRPEPLPRADHGRWTSHAEGFFEETDHLVQVAGITVGQIKKLKRAGITTVTGLAASTGRSVPKLDQQSVEKLAAQARLQWQTQADRHDNKDAPPRYETLPHRGLERRACGLGHAAAGPPRRRVFRYGGLSARGWRFGIPVRGLRARGSTGHLGVQGLVGARSRGGEAGLRGLR